MTIIAGIDQVFWSIVILYVIIIISGIIVFKDYRSGFVKDNKFIDNLHKSLYCFFSMAFLVIMSLMGYLIYAVHHLFSIEGIL